MASPSYLTLRGETQGLLSEGATTEESLGSLYRAGHKDEIQVQEFDYTSFTPTDNQAGQVVGESIEGPFRILKAMDSSSPLLAQAKRSGEQMAEFELKCFRSTSSDPNQHYYTIKLTEAVICDIKTVKPNCLDSTKIGQQVFQEVSFAYKGKEETHHISNKASEFSWGESE